MRRFFLFVVAVWFVTPIANPAGGQQPSTASPPLVVFLVRHAEKLPTGQDPELSEAGKARAQTLSHTLKDADLQHVHSTEYQRTMQTAAPIAKRTQQTIQNYNPGKLAQFANSLRKSGGRHLVVGHSNTTLTLVELLGGDAGLPMDEKAEYDRLYAVSVGSTGEVSSVLMRYGEPFLKK